MDFLSSQYTVFDSINIICLQGLLGFTTPEAELLSGLTDVLKTNPNVVYERSDSDGSTLLHSAAYFQSPEFCQLLINANPNLVRIRDDDGDLPVHKACIYPNVKTAIHLFNLYPESINNSTNSQGHCPLHAFCYSYFNNDDIKAIAELAQFLLQHDQGWVSKPSQDEIGRFDGCLPLHKATVMQSLAATKLVFDAYPEAIHIRNDDGETPLDYVRDCDKPDKVAFLERQIRWERRARKDRTPDSKGNLPIHRVLKSEYTLVGTIKLMLAAYPESVSMANSQGCIPLHIACQAGNLDAVKYIMSIDHDSLKTIDARENLPIHLACIWGRCNVIPCILEQSTYGVTMQNSDKLTPIELLLLESECDRDSIEYVEAIRSLLEVNPVDILECLMSKSKNTSDDVEQSMLTLSRLATAP